MRDTQAQDERGPGFFLVLSLCDRGHQWRLRLGAPVRRWGRRWVTLRVSVLWGPDRRVAQKPSAWPLGGKGQTASSGPLPRAGEVSEVQLQGPACLSCGHAPPSFVFSFPPAGASSPATAVWGPVPPNRQNDAPPALTPGSFPASPREF